MSSVVGFVIDGLGFGRNLSRYGFSACFDKKSSNADYVIGAAQVFFKAPSSLDLSSDSDKLASDSELSSELEDTSDADDDDYSNTFTFYGTLLIYHP